MSARMSKWQRLRLPEREGLPPLLYKYSGASKGYEIYITDLTLLWSEQLSNRQIRKRADEDDTTIDPSEDSEQFKVLLQKIEEALCSSPGSSMALTSGAKTDSLKLHLTTKLPAPLRPLKWNTYLSKEPLTAATNHLLLPLLREEKDRELHQRTLLDQLKQKDWVLGKLFDKIEVMGIELSTIFPGTSGLRGARKETSLAQAAKYIRGVAPFDEQAWLDEMSKSSPESGLTSNILKEISGSDSASDLEKVHPPPDGWWGSLDIRSTAAASPEPEARKETPEPEPSATKDTGQMDLDTASEDDDVEFEVCIKPDYILLVRSLSIDSYTASRDTPKIQTATTSQERTSTLKEARTRTIQWEKVILSTSAKSPTKTLQRTRQNWRCKGKTKTEVT